MTPRKDIIFFKYSIYMNYKNNFFVKLDDDY